MPRTVGATNRVPKFLEHKFKMACYEFMLAYQGNKTVVKQTLQEFYPECNPADWNAYLGSAFKQMKKIMMQNQTSGSRKKASVGDHCAQLAAREFLSNKGLPQGRLNYYSPKEVINQIC